MSARPPAMTAGIWWLLVRNEWFKTRKRLAFWMTLAFFAFVTTMTHGEAFLRARRDPEREFAFPEVWSRVFGDDATFMLVFASIVVVILACSEFSWRTARQNVIDGLSKTQWFWGKTSLLPILGIAFLTIAITIPGVMGILGTDLETATGPVLPMSVFGALGGIALAYSVVAGLAFALGLAIRSTGPAMAAWFFWVLMGEQLFGGLAVRFWPSVEHVVRYLPFSAANRLLGFENYDIAAYRRMVEAAVEAGRDIPQLPDLATTVTVNLGWVAFFMIVSFIWFRRRDL